jgi:hypothetical protein
MFWLVPNNSLLSFRRLRDFSTGSLDLGSESAYATITGSIFESGLSDAILQMWAAFCDELAHPGAMRQPFYCATPREAAQSHRIMTAALLSNQDGVVIHL